MRMNGYLIVAGVVLLVAVLLGWRSLIYGARNPDLSQRVHMVEQKQWLQPVLSADEVLAPLVADVHDLRTINPFDLQDQLSTRELRALPPPPPPPLDSPKPMMLPLPVEVTGEGGSR
ncbi:MAG: hypothetical protein EA401_02715 [Planctomycetota bacterium]|nr:MAG: hypothetical protein EA401_02715 [Planctomycetota bacterium]